MFSVTRKVLVEFDKLYAIAGVEGKDGLKLCLAASEGRDGTCAAVDIPSSKITTVWEEPGGTMTLCPVDSEGDFLATQKFWPVFDAAESVVVWAHKTPEGRYHMMPVRKIPYLHRFELMNLSWGTVMLAATLCGGKKDKDDWSQPGAVYAGVVENPPCWCLLDGMDEASTDSAPLMPVLTGLTKNHGFSVVTFRGRQVVLIAAAEGAFVLYPPETKNGTWEYEQLLNREVSDAFLYDLDGDGQEELVVIEGFHGNEVTVNKWKDGSFIRVWSTPVAFGHALWCGSIAGINCLLAGYRREGMELLLFMFSDRLDAPIMQTIGAGGPSQICVFPNEKGAEILSADRERGQAVLYTLVK